MTTTRPPGGVPIRMLSRPSFDAMKMRAQARRASRPEVMTPPPSQESPAPHPPLWFMLGMKRTEETILVLGFKLGQAAEARELMARRAKEEGISDYEMFNLHDPIHQVRDEIAGWLIAGGLTVDDAKESSVGVLKSIAAELKQAQRRGRAKRDRR